MDAGILKIVTLVKRAKRSGAFALCLRQAGGCGQENLPFWQIDKPRRLAGHANGESKKHESR